MRGRRQLIGWARFPPVCMWNVLTPGAVRLLLLSQTKSAKLKAVSASLRLRSCAKWGRERECYTTCGASQIVPCLLVPVLYEFTSNTTALPLVN
jgi:hypothetical protein